MTNHPTSPSIYISVLSDYNSGYCHGIWIDAALPTDEIWQHINKLYITSKYPNVTATVCNDCDYIKLYDHDKCSSCDSINIKVVPSAEEYAIHDYEGFAPFTVSEYSSIEEIADIAALLSDVNDDEDLAKITFLQGIYDDIATISAKIDDVNIYHGSRSDYAEELISNCYD
ncbi:MAG: antirestriction protein ArdA, partial [Pseudomonadota bacterium]|nr:antirestriction protein ArdA [Pseudomonadota bacterium]